MCGLAGILVPNAREPIDRGVLRRMTDSLLHRGPDGDGFYFGEGVALGHRRLSIIDVVGGAQPIFNEDRQVVTVFNGEIFNFRELTRELSGLGHRFATRSDTEVIVHAWEEWGEACVERFRGQFAFALWDARDATLFLARDRLGIKPLHYSILAGGRIVFGSELKAILRHPDVNRRLDPKAIEDYFAFGYVPDPKTIYSGVRKLPPGHTLCVRRGAGTEATPCEYWDLGDRQTHAGTERDLERELFERLGEAVSVRMLAEVPLGAFLSGGVDSSAVAGMMSRMSDGRIKTCSLGFEGAKTDERPYAQIVAREFGTDHADAEIAWPDGAPYRRLARIYDEPFADDSAYATERLCQYARRRVVVALSGDGADELLAGYRRYPWHLREERVRGLLPAWLRAGLFGPLGAVYPKLDWAPRPLRAQYTLRSLAGSALEGCARSLSIVPDEVRNRLFSRSLKRDLQGYRAIEALRPHWERTAGAHPLDRFQYLDIKTYLPGDILTKVDRASMAHSLEVRVPFLDHHFVEWASGIPAELRLANGVGKRILKRSLSGFLPDEILSRPKVGFSLPLDHWLAGPRLHVLRDFVMGRKLRELDLFNETAIEYVFSEHAGGRRDHGRLIWSLAAFAAFGEI